MNKPKLRVTEPDDDPPPKGIEETWESADKLKKLPITWMIPNLLRDHAVALIEGEKGVGKSTFEAFLAASITTGKPWFGRKKSAPASVLWLSAEEEPEIDIWPRLKVAGADFKRVKFTRKDELGVRERFFLPGDVPRIREAVDFYGCKLVVIDPLSSHVPADLSLTIDQQIHQVLDPLQAMCADIGCVALLARNLTKDKGASRLDRGQGGAGVAGVARSVIVIDWPDRNNRRRVLRSVACNSASENVVVEYELSKVKGGAMIEKVKFLTAQEDNADLEALPADEKDESIDAETLLRRVLKKGRVSVEDITSEALSAGIGIRTLRKAKVRLGCKSYRVGTTKPAHWEWGPPIEGW